MKAFIVTETVSLFELFQELLSQFGYEAIMVSDQNRLKFFRNTAGADIIIVVGLMNKPFDEVVAFFKSLRTDWPENPVFWLTDYNQPEPKCLIDLNVVSLPQLEIVDSVEKMMDTIRKK